MQTRLTPLCFRCRLISCGVNAASAAPGAACVPALLDAFRWLAISSPNTLGPAEALDFIVDHDLVFGFLQFHHLAEIRWACPPCLCENDFCRRSRNRLRSLPSARRIATEECRALVCFITWLERAAQSASTPGGRPSSASCLRTLGARFTPFGISWKPLRTAHHPAGRIEQFAVRRSSFALALLCLWPAAAGQSPVLAVFTLRLRSRIWAPSPHPRSW